ncbi:MAG: Tryptophan synthase (indole-salvaging), partial [uncultured Rubrobacteraceae bacterium]
ADGREARREVHSAADKVPARREAHPRVLVQPRAGPALPVGAAAQPGDHGAGGARGVRADLPRGDHPPGGHGRTLRPDSRGGARDLRPLAPDPPLPRPPPGEAPRHPGPHLLQVRGREPFRKPQTEHGRPPGLLQQEGRRPPPDHRDRRRPVGLLSRLRLRNFRPRMHSLHGPRLLRPEALPPHHDGDLRRGSPPEPDGPDAGGPRHPGRAPRLPGVPWYRDLRGRRGRRQERRRQVLPWQRAQPRAAPPDRDRPGGPRTDGAGWRVPGRGRRLRRRRLELRRHSLPVYPGELEREQGHPHHRRRAGLLPDAHQGPLRLRLRRHRRHHPDDEDVHARALVRAERHPRRRPALPRRLAHRLGPRPRGARRGAGLRPEPDLRGRRRVRPGRGHRARPGGDTRYKGDHRPRPRSEGDREREDHPLQPLRPRPLRLLRLRAVPGREPRQPGALRRGDRGGRGRDTGV